MKITVAICALTLAISNASGNMKNDGQRCVPEGEYDADNDYFPDKVTGMDFYGDTWDVSTSQHVRSSSTWTASFLIASAHANLDTASVWRVATKLDKTKLSVRKLRCRFACCWKGRFTASACCFGAVGDAA